VLDRETKLLALRGEFADHKTAATGEIEKRTNEISSLSQRLRDIEKSVEKNIDSRIQRAASRACREIWFLRLALVMLYLVIVGCAYWFIPSKDEYRIYTLVATVVIAMIGSGFISQIAYEKLARPIWLRRLVSLCDELDVSEHLRRYEVDSVKMRVTKATTQ